MRSSFERWVNTERPSLHSAVHTYDESMALVHVMDAAWLAWQAAVAHEREACAKACEDYAGTHAKDDDNSKANAWMMLQCASVIRARSKT